ncbi:acyltransferase [Asticcacaulis sp. AC460]|uniref:acyltransferase family protein n=1 Tax=Asticcacaulis sp. AC460 TaxID=1282360 RepID=UPI0003C3B154|nr:acyltransferase [Asticcacaulis sp. AC460]ESQ90234.1 acyltransferase [Asticcacaulis sp. AC460]
MQDHLKPLTSLRFFAAAWVVLYTYIHELNTPISFGLMEHGYLGVDLFFILSGFILSHVYLDSVGEGRFSYGTFVNHRLARVYPLHAATLLFAILLIGAAALKGVQLDPNAQNWAALPAHLTLTQAWGLAPSASFNHPSWSISAEWFAYLCFPVVAWGAWRLRHRPITAVAIAAAVVVALNLAFGAIAGFPLTKATFQWGALRIVPTFLFGAALYLAWRNGAVSNPKLAVAGAVIASLTVIIATSFYGIDTISVLALGLLVLSLAGFGRDEQGAETGGILSSKVLVYLGEISFATYMIYVPWKWVYLKGVNMLLGSEGPLPFFWWLAGLIALIPLSMLAHHLIERPFRNIIRDLGARWASRKREIHLSLGE